MPLSSQAHGSCLDFEKAAHMSQLETITIKSKPQQTGRHLLQKAHAERELLQEPERQPG